MLACAAPPGPACSPRWVGRVPGGSSAGPPGPGLDLSRTRPPSARVRGEADFKDLPDTHAQW